MGDITVSIIIPVYNVVDYLDQCLESVVDQTYQDLEIILINDGSTDESDQKCIDWAKKDSRIIYISKKNEGLGSSRNLGIKISSGEYIAFLDSDDWLDNTFIEKMLDCALKLNADLAFCDYYKVDNDTGKKRAFNTKLYTEEITSVCSQPQLLYGADVAMWIKLYKREILTEHELVIPDIPYEDTAVYALIASECSVIAHRKEKLLYYRENRSGSILNKIENRKYAVNALRYVCDGMKKQDRFDTYYKQLERFAVRFVSYSVRELKFLDDSERHIQILLDFLDEYFPGWRNPYSYKFCTIGSNNLYCMINQIPYDLDNTYHFDIDEGLNQNFNDYDYIFIDLQPNAINDNICNEKISRLISKLGNKLNRKRAYLVKNELTLTYGEYQSEYCFSNQCEIDVVNEKLRKAYMKIERQFEMLGIIEIVKENVFFSDINSRHGCSPCHLNDMFFTEMADRIINTIR